MGYSFEGVFIKDSSITPEDAAKLFGGHAQAISEPFQGIGVSFEETLTQHSGDEIKKAIMRHSKALGDCVVVYINYSTFGGPCEHCYGFACRDGDMVSGSEVETEDDLHNEALKHLLRYLGVNREGSHFAPFRRGFFPNT